MNTHTVRILLYNSFPLWLNGFIKPYGFVIVSVFFIKAQIIKQLTIGSALTSSLELSDLHPDLKSYHLSSIRKQYSMKELPWKEWELFLNGDIKLF